MVSIYTEINQVKHRGKIVSLEPQVNINIDVGDNFDLEKMRDLQEKLVRLLWKGLNDALV